MNGTDLQAELQSKQPRLPGSAKTARYRAEELARFNAQGFPGRHHEDWRYTDLQPIARGTFDFVPPQPTVAAIASTRALLAGASLDDAAPRLVFVDGHYSSELSTPAHELGLEALNLAERWDRFEGLQTQRNGLANHRLAALNTAFAQQGAWLGVPTGVRVAEPLHLIFVASGVAGLAVQPRVLIDLARSTELTVVQHYLDGGDPENWSNPVTQVQQGSGSTLTLYRLQEHGANHLHTELLYAELADDAALTAGYVDLGGRLTRNDIDVKLLAPGARVELFGVFLAAGQHVDNHTRIDHVSADTHSDEAFRGLIGRRGRGVFNGKVVVHRDARRINAHQKSDTLLLHEEAEIDTKPELEIYADDVKCSHGATVGELDIEQLFYLRSRGIDENAARGLLTAAFAATVLERIKLPALRERITGRVAARLNAWENAQ
jgi:Fe-S cluster assembly protein SufD